MQVLIVLGLLGATAPALPAAGPDVRHIEKLRDLHLETPLVTGGKAAAVVAASGPNAALARELVTRVKQLTGVALPIVDDKTLTEKEFRSTHVVVIGNFTNNKVAELLYFRRRTFEDYIYPGIAGDAAGAGGKLDTGYVIRTVHDPFALGHNFIVLAGSEPAGTTEAVRQFAAGLSGKGGLVVPHTVKVRIGGKQLMKPAYGKTELPQNVVDKLIDQSRTTISRMPSLQNNVWYSTYSYALGYHLTGLACWGKVYKGQMEILAENLPRFNTLPNNYIEGLHKLLPAWELMECTSVFSDSERLKFTNVVLEVACRNAAAWESYLKHARREAIDSHGGERVQSLRLAGLFFDTRYGINRRWVTMSEEAVRFLDETSRSCDGYHVGCGHGPRVTQYARYSGDMRYFEGDACRHQADLVMMCTDNNGRMVTVGDHGRLDTDIGKEFDVERFLSEAAWYYKDSSYLWFTQHLAYHEHAFGGYCTGERPKLPQRLVGLNVLPVEANLYETIHDDEPQTNRTFEPAPRLSVPHDKAFDKLTFREAIDPRKQYLMLDGISGLDHGHLDGNSIIRFNDLERIWLVDDGNTRVFPRDHNMLLVVKDGQSRAPQKLTRLDLAAELDSVAFSKTTTEDYNGIDWSRHLVWLKGEYVLALDRAIARTAGDYTLRCRWRCPGEAVLRDAGLLVTQGGPQFRILSADGSRARLRQLQVEDTSESIRKYPYVNSRGDTIVYDNVYEKSLTPGKGHTFQNLFYASSEKVRRDYRIEHVDDSTVRIVSPRGTAFAGLAKDGAPFLLARGRFCAAGARSLGEGSLFRADHPIDIEYDLLKGRGVVVARTPTRLSLTAPAAQGKLDGEPLAGESQGGLTTILIPAGKHTVSFEPSPEGIEQLKALAVRFAPADRKTLDAKPAAVRGLATIWEVPAMRSKDAAGQRAPQGGAEILDMTLADLDGDGTAEIVTAGQDGGVSVLGLDGKLRWRQTGLDQVNSIAVAHWNGKGQVVAGCRKAPYLFVFDARGTRLEGNWAKLSVAGDTYKGLAAPVRFVSVADLNGDGVDEVLVAARPVPGSPTLGHYYAYGEGGRMLWHHQPLGHEAAAVTVAPLKRGGPKVWFVADAFATPEACVGRDGTGREVFRALTSHRPTVVTVADLNGDGTNKILLGGNDNYVHLHSADGRRVWVQNVGGPASGIIVADVSGDGKPEIIVATAEMGHNLLALDAQGTRLWQAKAGEEVNALAVGNILAGRRGQQIVVGTDGGSVQVFDGAGRRVAEMGLAAAVARLALVSAGEAGRSDIVVALKDGTVQRLAAQ